MFDSILMNRLLSISISILLLSCNAEKPSDKVEEVETGLQTLIRVAGDPTWNIHDRMDFYGIKGLSIAVIKDFKIDWVKGYGIKESESQQKVTTETLFRAGSISKPIAAYITLKLVEDGMLSLDEDVNQYLTSWEIPENDFTKHEPVTLRRLLSHTAGINLPGGGGYESDPYPTLLDVLTGSSPAHNGPVAVRTLPGARFSYSGGGYGILQQILEDRSKQSFEVLIQKHLFDPLLMTNSTFTQIPFTGKWDDLAATGYLENKVKIPEKSYYNALLAAGGLWTTPTDLAQFVIDFQNSLKSGAGKILGKDMVNEMTKSPLSSGYGLGIENDGNYLFHYGASAGFTAHMIFHRSEGYGVIVMQNGMETGLLGEVDRSVASAYKWQDYLEPEYRSMAISEEEFHEITGRYQTGIDALFEVIREGNRLYLEHSSGKVELVKTEGNEYVRRDNHNKYQFFTNSNAVYYCRVLYTNQFEVQFEKLNKDDKLPTEFLEENNYEAARKAYDHLIYEFPEQSDRIMNRLINKGVNLVYEDRQFEEGIKVVRLATQLFPEKSDTWANLAWCYEESGDIDSAIINYGKAIDLNPEDNYSRSEWLRLNKVKASN